MLPVDGLRGQVKGLIYDEAFAGFEPATWPVVVEEETLQQRLRLEPAHPPLAFHDVDVQRSAQRRSVDRELLGITIDLVDKHAAVRPSGGTVGKMVGIGEHLDYQGNCEKFVVKGEKQDRKVRQKVQSALVVAGAEFSARFAGRDVGYEEMLTHQESLLPRRGGDMVYPVCWDASAELGNESHRDRDAARSFAGWFCVRPGASGSWMLLFPPWGVVIMLRMGTWVSWNGRFCDHCSAVPRVAEGDSLVSLFASLPADLCSVLSREQACGAVIAERMEPGHKGEAVGLFEQLRKGMRVSLRWSPPAPEHLTKRGKRTWGQCRFRWLQCHVAKLDEERGTVDVRERGGMRYHHEGLTSTQVWNRLVIGWY